MKKAANVILLPFGDKVLQRWVNFQAKCRRASNNEAAKRFGEIAPRAAAKIKYLFL